MPGCGIAYILRQMRKVDVLVGEMQQIPRTLAGAEQRKEMPVSSLNRCRKRDGDNPASAAQLAAVTGSAGEFSDLQNRARDAGIEFALRQDLAKAQEIEFGAGERVAGVMLAQTRDRRRECGR